LAQQVLEQLKKFWANCKPTAKIEPPIYQKGESVWQEVKSEKVYVVTLPEVVLLLPRHHVLNDK